MQIEDLVKLGWMQVQGHSSYWLSPRGECYSCKKKGSPGKMLVWVIVKSYPTIRLNGKSYRVNVLVAKMFLGIAPEGKPWVLHNDGDEMNNLFTNLRYGTAQENAEDREKHGRTSRGEDHAKAIRDSVVRNGKGKLLTLEQVREIKVRLNGYKRGDCTKIAGDMKIPPYLVSSIKRGLIWKEDL